MTIETTKKLIAQLIIEDANANRELIEFYQRKISEAYVSAIEKAFNN